MYCGDEEEDEVGGGPAKDAMVDDDEQGALSMTAMPNKMKTASLGLLEARWWYVRYA